MPPPIFRKQKSTALAPLIKAADFTLSACSLRVAYAPGIQTTWVPVAGLTIPQTSVLAIFSMLDHCHSLPIPKSQQGP